MKKIPAVTVFLLVSLMIAACTPVLATRGNLLSSEQYAKVQVQKSTRADVVTAASPTVSSPFDQNTWYYIGERTSQKGIYAPVVLQRRIVRVTFSKSNNDTVTEVADIDPRLGQDVTPVSQTTPAAGKEYTFLQQMIGNVGKYNTDSSKKQQ